MNFLNKTQGAMSLAADVAGIASGIGRGGSLAGFLRDLGHTCCSTPAALRQAIRVRGYKDYIVGGVSLFCGLLAYE